MASPIDNSGFKIGGFTPARKAASNKPVESEVRINDGFQAGVHPEVADMHYGMLTGNLPVSKEDLTKFEADLGTQSSALTSAQVESAPMHPEVAEQYWGMVNGQLSADVKDIQAFEGMMGLGVISQVKEVSESLGAKGTTLGVECNGINSTQFFGLSGRKLA
jgi:hypothetical protein